MTIKVKIFLGMIFVVLLSNAASLAQTPARRQINSAPGTEEQTQPLQQGANLDTVANEIGMLRQSLQALNARLREISERLLTSDSRQGDAGIPQQNRIAVGLELLSRAEQRAEVLRKQLLDLIEKETALRGRLVQIDEEIRPDSIERASSLTGSTRAPEQREVRRRVLDNERRGYESLLRQTADARARLEDDVKQADALAARLRQRVLPLIEREIDKINPNP